MEKDYKLYKLVWNEECSYISSNRRFKTEKIVQGRQMKSTPFYYGPNDDHIPILRCRLRDGTRITAPDVPVSALTEYYTNPLVEYLMCL